MTRRLLLAAVLVLATGGCAATLRRSDGGPPDSFVRTTADARTTRVIPLRDGLSKAQSWRILSDALTAGHTVDVRDQQAGFMMTAWETSVAREGVPDLRYRTRIVTRFLGEDWRELQLRVEANWRSGEEWDVGVDQALLDTLAFDLTMKLGRK
jgi:hypothetical protein